jgi:hypothetical protein
VYGYLSVPTQVGQSDTKLAIVSCPPCSYMRDGECVVCMDGEPHPACNGCSGGAVVWYRTPFFVSLVTSLVASGIVMAIVYGANKRLTSPP